MRVFTTFDQLSEAVGEDLGTHRAGSRSTQERVDAFADATGDHQWIHVDVERAKDGPVRRHHRARLPHAVADPAVHPRAVQPRDPGREAQLRRQQGAVPEPGQGRLAHPGHRRRSPRSATYRPASRWSPATRSRSRARPSPPASPRPSSCCSEGLRPFLRRPVYAGRQPSARHRRRTTHAQRGPRDQSRGDPGDRRADRPHGRTSSWTPRAAPAGRPTELMTGAWQTPGASTTFHNKWTEWSTAMNKMLQVGPEFSQWLRNYAPRRPGARRGLPHLTGGQDEPHGTRHLHHRGRPDAHAGRSRRDRLRHPGHADLRARPGIPRGHRRRHRRPPQGDLHRLLRPRACSSAPTGGSRARATRWCSGSPTPR